jgi:hypothetical protein
VNIRVCHEGITFECDDIATAIELAEALKPQPSLPLRPVVRVARTPKQAKATPPPKPRGASPGAIDGRILAALAAGPMKPSAVVEQCGADKVSVRDAFKALESDGKVRAEGHTASRRWMLATPRPRLAKEAV